MCFFAQLPPHKKINGLILSLFNRIVVILNALDGKKDEIPSEMFAPKFGGTENNV